MAQREARKDRQPFGVFPKRGKWTGWFYDAAGKRVNGVPLYFPSDASKVPVPIPVTRADPDDCPNKFKAQERIKAIAEAPAVPTRKAVTLLDAIDQWAVAAKTQGNTARYVKRKSDVLRSTIQGVTAPGPVNKAGVRQLLIPGTGWANWHAISRHSLREFLARMDAAGRAPSTRNKYQSTWVDFLSWCVDDEIIRENPLLGMRRAKGGGMSYIRRPFQRVEFQVLLDTVDPETRMYYAVLGLAGLRWSEGQNLRKRDFDPTGDRPLWKLPPQLQKVKLPKTLPMMPRLANMLAQRWYLLKDGDLFFTRKWKMKHLEADCRRAGICIQNAANEHIAFHSFRYFFATEMSKIMPMRQVQLLLRHKDLMLTMNLYSKLHLEDLQDQWKIPDLW